MEERADRMPGFVKRNYHTKIGIVSAFYGLVLAGCAPTALCGDTDSDCLTLEVEGAVEGTPVRIELLDAAGQRLARYRTKTSSPERIIQVKPDGFALHDVACVRVRSGEGPDRRIANVRLSAATSSHRRDLAVALQSQAEANPDAAFKLVSIPLVTPEVGRSVKISTLPDKTQSVLILGTKLTMSPTDESGRLTFYQLGKDGNSFDKLNDPAPIALNMPPSPIVTARKRSGGSLLAVGRSSQDPVPSSGTPVLWPLLYRGAGGQYTLETTALPPPDSSTQAVSLTAASLNDDGIPDFIINYVDASMPKSGAWILTSDAGNLVYKKKNVIFDGMKSDVNMRAVLFGKKESNSSSLIISNNNNVTYLNFDSDSNAESVQAQLEAMGSGMNKAIGVVVGNYDKDENTDLAALINQKNGLSGQEVHVWLANDVGNLDPERKTSVATRGTRPRVAISEDLNGDQFDDIATVDFGDLNAGSGHVSVIHGGRTVLSASGVEGIESASSAALLDISAGDLNGDCKQDLAVVSYADSKVYILLNQTNFPVMPL